MQANKQTKHREALNNTHNLGSNRTITVLNSNSGNINYNPANPINSA